MKEISIFGETLCGQPTINPSAGARTQKTAPCHGLFGTKLIPDDGGASRPGIGPDKLPKTLS